MRDIGYFRPFEHLLPVGEMFPRTMQPAMDLYQKEDEVVVNIDVPGVENKDDLEVSVSADSLSVRGKILRSDEIRNEDYYHSERSFGSFFRSIPLPRGLNVEEARANYHNGVLKIRIPKAEKESKRKLDVDIQ